MMMKTLMVIIIRMKTMMADHGLDDDDEDDDGDNNNNDEDADG